MSTDNNDITILMYLENPCTFLLAKEKTWKCIFNTNSELSQNRTEKQIMPSKTTVNWLFNDIWHYLVIACFDREITIFQETVVRVFYILKNVGERSTTKNYCPGSLLSVISNVFEKLVNNSILDHLDFPWFPVWF